MGLKSPSEFGLKLAREILDLPAGNKMEAIALKMDELTSQPWLGNATTGQLLDEVKARVNCDYRTVDDNEVKPPCLPTLHR